MCDARTQRLHDKLIALLDAKQEAEAHTTEVGCPRCKEIEVALVNGVMLSHDGYPCTNQDGGR